MNTEKAKLEAELASLRAERAARAASRDEALDLQRLRDQIQDEGRTSELEQQLVDAEAKHGPLGRGVAVVHATYADGHVLGSIIVKRPHQATWKRFRDRISDDKAKKGDEIDRLWRSNIVWPDVATVDRYVAELPFTDDKLADACAALCGVRSEEAAGK